MSTRQEITRREFLSTSGKAAMAGPAVLGGAPAILRFSEQQRKRPNILLIMSDEHNPAVAGCYGNRLVRTSHIDELAANGVTFDRCYTNSPLCVPARAAVTAGKYASRIGAWNNSTWLPSPDYPSIARVLNAAGYQSFLGGKMHYDASCRYGFHELAPFPTNAGYMTGKGNRRAAGDTRVNAQAWRGRADTFHPGDQSGTLRHDRMVMTACTQFLANRKTADKPFFLLAGFLAPHFPLTVPQAYCQYEGRVPMPGIPAGHLDSLPLNYQHLRRGFGIPTATADEIKRGRELYYGLVQWVDDQIGEMLTLLRNSPLGDNTLVIYTADHGENMGEHGLWWKNCMFEPAARIPLIVNWPERWKGGQRRIGACSQLDVVRTITDVGGAQTPPDWDGASLTAWMDNARTTWKDLAVSEYYAHNIASGYTMVRSGDFKYVYHCRMDQEHGPQRELYNLADDPAEMKNLAGGAQHAKKMESMHALILKELKRDPDETEQVCRAAYARGYGRPPGPGAAVDPAA